MVDVVCDLVIDFQTITPDSDIRLARSVMTEFEKLFDLRDGSFDLGEAQAISMGWSFARLYLSREFAQKLYENNSYEIDMTKDASRTYRFLRWINAMLEHKGCKAQLKYADSMKDSGMGDRYGSHLVTIFSDEFASRR
jgi:hypothetical protein